MKKKTLKIPKNTNKFLIAKLKFAMDFVSYIVPYSSYKFSELYRRFFGNSVSANTTLGPIRGVESISCSGYNYYEFRGIPYGKPPVGKLRFKVYIYLINNIP